MKRRAFLRTAGVGGASAVAAPAIGQGLLEWRMVTSWPKGLPGLGAGAPSAIGANVVGAVPPESTSTLRASTERGDVFMIIGLE